MPPTTSRRLKYAALTGAVLLVGLGVHFRGALLNARVRDSLGDALWATMIAAGISTLMPRQRPMTRYIGALCICYAVEFSQLWHTPALDQLRATRMGALVLGSGFDWRDLVAYACGIAMFAWLDERWVSRLKA
ncbi:MAG: DUF2809 domain-containing protein [Gemmatimonadaceae bacterium]